MIKFQYDENGNLVAVEDGEKIGKVVTMGDILEDSTEEVNSDASKVHKLQD